MDPRSIAPDLSMKGLSGKAVHQDLVQPLGAEAVAYPTRIWHLYAPEFPCRNKEAPEDAGVTRTDSVEAAILNALTDNLFSSVGELSRLTCLSRSTVHRRLTELLVPFAIFTGSPISPQTIKINLSRELVRVLQRQQTHGWHEALNLDESWLYFSADQDRI
jgi:hypothetical protein